MADFEAPLTLPNSILVQSGVFGSAPIEGTIGSFLATIFGASGLNSSGPLNAPSIVVASGGVNSSGPLNAPSVVVVSILNVSGPEAATSLIAASNLQLSAGAASFAGSLWVQSGLQLSTTLFGGSATFVSGLNTSAVANFGGIVTVTAGLSAATNLNVGTFLSVQGSGIFVSGLNTSAVANFAGPVTVTGGLSVTTNLNVGTFLSVQGSGIFVSGLNTSALVNIGGNFSGGGIGKFTSALLLEAGLSGQTGVFDGLVSFKASIVVSALLVSGVVTLQGGTRLGHVSISASGTITPASSPIFLVDTTGASINVGLPSAATVSFAYFYILKKSSDGNSLIVSAATGDNIEGAAALSNTAAYTQTLLWTPGSITWYRLLPSTGIL